LCGVCTVKAGVMLKKADAVVLKTLNHGDTSKIITLYSREVGRLKLIAKGVRSPKSKAAGLFQPTRQVQVVYYSKEQSELQLFKSGELLNGFFGLEQDFDRLTLAQVVVELLDRSVEDEESHEPLFQLLVATLGRLADKQISTARSFWYFHLHLLLELGFRPQTEQCVICQAPLEAGGYLGNNSPQLECSACHLPDKTALFVPPAIIEATQILLEHDWQDLPALSLTANDRKIWWDFLWRYTFYHIESTRGMRSLRVLRQLYS